FQDATILLFSMHGMGPNRSDVPGMVLLPELLHRYAFGRSFFVQPEAWTHAANGVPILGQKDVWHVVTPDPRSIQRRIRDGVVRRTRDQAGKFLPKNAKEALKHILRQRQQAVRGEAALERRRSSLDWMPAARYRPLWPKMPAFALPAYYDGQIRI